MTLFEWLKETYYSFFDEVYEGDTFNGEGIVYYRNGNVKYTGRWKNSVYHGPGKLYTYKGDLHYEGLFEKGVYNGQGTLYDTFWASYGMEDKYVGEFKDGNKFGLGSIVKDGVTVYKGTFDKTLVKGMMFDGDVVKFDGEFKDGCCYKGKIYITGGVTLEGFVDANCPNRTIGPGFLFTVDGLIYRTLDSVPYGDKLEKIEK